MPTSQRRKKPTTYKVEHVEAEDISGTPEDLEIRTQPRSSKKSLPLSQVITDTLTDRISATAAYGISGSMLNTVGRNYAITPVEAYNIVYPTTRILTFYMPSTIIKMNLPTEVADNVVKIVVTSLEYITRITSGYVKALFEVRLQRAGIREAYPVKDTKPVTQSPAAENVDDLDDLLAPLDLPATKVSPNGQVTPGPTGFNYEELIAEGIIVGDTGQNM